jgi:hypothetical protein
MLSMEPDRNPKGEPSRPLDAETVLELWSRTYNTAGKPDFSHLFPYYHPDIVFQDSIQRVEGLVEFKALCTRLTARTRSLRMDLSSVVQDGQTIFLEWKMTLSFRKNPDAPIYGCTKLTLHEDGRIVAQRDYYDLWGDIFDAIPWFRKGYRRFMHRRFG